MSRKGMGSHQSAHMGKDEWLTPPDLLTRLGEFDLDPCAALNQPWKTAKHQYTVQDDGLSQPWFGRVWCNPPYGLQAEAWLKRCSEHQNAIALIFARTETEMWAKYVWGSATAILFLKGRLYFYHGSGQRAEANSGAPSALIAYGIENAGVLVRSGIPGWVVPIKRIITLGGQKCNN